MIIRNKIGQAAVEIAVFGSLIILAVGALLSYTRTIREQQLLEQQVFRQALKDAYEHKFNVTDIKGDVQTDYGATVSYSKSLDKQAELLFEPNRRGYSASSTILWSGAEDPPALNKMRVNQDNVTLSNKTITYFRSNEATDAPDRETQMSALDTIAILAPVAVQFVGSKWFSEHVTDWAADFLKEYGDYVALALKIASYAYLLTKYTEAESKMNDIEARNAALKDQDKQMSKWGWRVASEAKGDANPGKEYLKDIDAQIWDSRQTSSTQNVFSETKTEDFSRIDSTRSASLTDTVRRTFKLRYDVTTPNSTIAPSLHTYEYISDVSLSQGLGADRNYSSSQAGTIVSQELGWTTPH
ncbi:MAG: hypothetical protein KKA59_08215 [Candidatus Omnitrophica bacterium]|nr:hypothetical protein [Candidatus Omnitrophota bacterium]